MRTPVLVVAGQHLTEAVCDVLVEGPGTVVITHRFDGQVVIRGVAIRRGGRTDVSHWPLEVSNSCIGCTTRDDLLILLRRLHRREDVSRIVIHLDAWLNPDPSAGRSTTSTSTSGRAISPARQHGTSRFTPC